MIRKTFATLLEYSLYCTVNDLCLEIPNGMTFLNNFPYIRKSFIRKGKSQQGFDHWMVNIFLQRRLHFTILKKSYIFKI
jgi:hypothetical protein